MRHTENSAEHFSQQWSSLAASSINSLERNDRLYVSRITSYDEVKAISIEAQSYSLLPSAVQELSALTFALENFKKFIDGVSAQAQPTTDNTTFWGLVGLVLHVSTVSVQLLIPPPLKVIKLCRSEEGVAPRLPRRLRNVCQDIDYLNKCRGKGARYSSESRDSCFCIANSLVTLLVAIITFIREFMEGHSMDAIAWKLIEEQFKNFSSETGETVSRLEKLFRLSELEDISQLNSALAALPKMSTPQSIDEQALPS